MAQRKGPGETENRGEDVGEEIENEDEGTLASRNFPPGVAATFLGAGSSLMIVGACACVTAFALNTARPARTSTWLGLACLIGGGVLAFLGSGALPEGALDRARGMAGEEFGTGSHKVH